VECTKHFTGDYLEEEPVLIKNIFSNTSKNPSKPSGEFIGLIKLTGKGTNLVKSELNKMERENELAQADIPNLLNRIIKNGGQVEALYITGHWLDVDDAFDLANARNLI
tara:strand:- start:143 stop:469 length:327 start_codon:yes stop_codon:yes gene_type:complete